MKEPDFKINYKGKEIDVYKVSENIFHADLTSTENKPCFLLISKINNVWSLMDSRSGEVLSVDLHCDGKITYKQGASEENRVVHDFDPQIPLTNSPIDNAIRTILEFESEMFSQKGACKIPAEDFIKVRKELLDSTLKMLGYSTYNDVLEGKRNNIAYVGLRRIVSQFLSCKDLRFIGYVQNANEGIEPTIMARLPDGLAPIQAATRVNQYNDTIKANSDHIERIDDLIMRNDDASPNFLQNIKRFDPDGIYAKATRQIALLYLTLNADLLPPNECKTAFKIRQRLEQEMNKQNLTNPNSNSPIEHRFVIASRKLFEEAIEIEESFARMALTSAQNAVKAWENKLIDEGAEKEFISKNAVEIRETNKWFEMYLSEQKEIRPFDDKEKDIET